MFKRTVLVLAVGLVASLASMQAATCTAQTFSAPLTDGFNCQLGDKIFSNFSGDTSFGGTITFTEITSTQYSLTYTPGATPITGIFNFGFWVAVDAVNFPSNFIVQVTDQMNTVQAGVGGLLVPNASTDAVTHNPGGVVNLNAAGTGTGESGQTTMLTQLEKISMVYNANGAPANGPAGQLTSMEFRIAQGTVPEPMTFSLMGAGLLGLGLLRKRIGRS
jgi:hypothetical protein